MAMDMHGRYPLHQALDCDKAVAQHMPGSWHLRTDPGASRERQEDALAVAYIRANEGACALALVCDGVGGCAFGQEASRLTVAKLIDWVASHPDPLADLGATLRDGLLHIDSELRQDFEGRALTTVSAVLLDATGRACAINVGDSRIYEWSGQKLTQLSEDDNYRTQLAKVAVNIDERYAGILTQALGRIPDGEDDALAPQVLQPGDGVIVLCSDGVHDCSRQRDEWAATVIGYETIEQLVAETFALVQINGGRDNASMLVLHNCAAVAESLRQFDFEDHDVHAWAGADLVRMRVERRTAAHAVERSVRPVC